HSMVQQFVGRHQTPWLIVVVSLATPHQVKIGRGQYGERHTGFSQPVSHSLELRMRHAGGFGDMANGDSSPVFMLLGPPADVPDIHAVAGGSEIEMHVNVNVELPRHLKYPIDLASGI